MAGRCCFAGKNLAEAGRRTGSGDGRNGGRMMPATFRKATFNRESEAVRLRQIMAAAGEYLAGTAGRPRLPPENNDERNTPCRVVDLGSGSGLIGMLIRKAGGEVTIVDASSSRVSAEARPFFHQADAVTYSLEPFDLIVCVWGCSTT